MKCIHLIAVGMCAVHRGWCVCVCGSRPQSDDPLQLIVSSLEERRSERCPLERLSAGRTVKQARLLYYNTDEQLTFRGIFTQGFVRSDIQKQSVIMK